MMKKRGHKKNRSFHIVEFNLHGKLVAEVQTSLWDAKNDRHGDDWRHICMVAEHVSNLQAELDKLKGDHTQLKAAYDELAKRVEMLWMAPNMPGAVMATQHYIENAAKQE